MFIKVYIIVVFLNSFFLVEFIEYSAELLNWFQDFKRQDFSKNATVFRAKYPNLVRWKGHAEKS